MKVRIGSWTGMPTLRPTKAAPSYVANRLWLKISPDKVECFWLLNNRVSHKSQDKFRSSIRHTCGLTQSFLLLAQIKMVLCMVWHMLIINASYNQYFDKHSSARICSWRASTEKSVTPLEIYLGKIPRGAFNNYRIFSKAILSSASSSRCIS